MRGSPASSTRLGEAAKGQFLNGLAPKKVLSLVDMEDMVKLKVLETIGTDGAILVAVFSSVVGVGVVRVGAEERKEEGQGQKILLRQQTDLKGRLLAGPRFTQESQLTTLCTCKQSWRCRQMELVAITIVNPAERLSSEGRVGHPHHKSACFVSIYVLESTIRDPDKPFVNNSVTRKKVKTITHQCPTSVHPEWWESPVSSIFRLFCYLFRPLVTHHSVSSQNALSHRSVQ